MEGFKFQPGDRVMYISSEITDGNEELTAGCVGTVIRVAHRIGVEWDNEMIVGHSLGGKCRNGRGYWVSEDRIVLDESEDNADQDVNGADFEKILTAGN